MEEVSHERVAFVIYPEVQADVCGAFHEYLMNLILTVFVILKMKKIFNEGFQNFKNRYK
jgi:hypothetical protein